jgi:glycosyltransferase involved in cell wall biosynthesis
MVQPTILLVSYLDAVDRGGQVNLLRLAELLAGGPLSPVVGVPGRGPLWSKLGSMGIRAVELRIPTHGKLLQELTRGPQRRRAGALIRELAPRVVYVDAAEHAPLVRELAPPGTRIVWHAQTAVSTRWDAAAIRAADVVVSVSPSVDRRIALAGTPPARLVSIPNGVDLEAFTPGPPTELRARAGSQKILLCVAAIEREKGVSELLHALSTSRHSDAILWMVGRGDDETTKRYQALAQALGVSARVSWCGRTTDVRSFYRSADLFVFPTYAEGLPLALLEAMACGRACVASDVLGVSHLLEGGAGRLVPKADAAALRDAIDELLDHPAQREALGAAARARAVERFGLEGFRRAFQGVFEELAR